MERGDKGRERNREMVWGEGEKREGRQEGKKKERRGGVVRRGVS